MPDAAADPLLAAAAGARAQAGAGVFASANPKTGHVEPRAAAKTARVRVLPKPAGTARARGHGQPLDTAYRLADGRLVIVSP